MKRSNASENRAKRVQMRKAPEQPPQGQVHMHLNVWIDTDQYPVEVTQAYLNIGPQRTLEQAVNDLEKEYHAKMQHLYQVSKTLEQILIQFLQAGIQPAKGTRISCDFGDYQIDEINLKHYPNRIPTITVVVVDAI